MCGIATVFVANMMISTVEWIIRFLFAKAGVRLRKRMSVNSSPILILLSEGAERGRKAHLAMHLRVHPVQDNVLRTSSLQVSCSSDPVSSQNVHDAADDSGF